MTVGEEIVGVPLYEVRTAVGEAAAHLAIVGGGPGLIEDARDRLDELARRWDATGDGAGELDRAGSGRSAPSPETTLLLGLAEQGAAEPGWLVRGLAADLVAADLMDGGAVGVCVNIGGDVRAAGVSPRHGGWRVGLRGSRGRTDGLVLLRDAGVATAGRPGRVVHVVASQAWSAAVLARHALSADAARAVRVLEAAGASALLIDGGRRLEAGRWSAFATGA